MFFKNLVSHLKTVHNHRKAVRKLCFKMGIPLQGLLHDLSKYSLIELSVAKYYNGKQSPHEIMRQKYGYSTSWYHHKNKNKHHWEFWVDDIELGTAVKIPYKYVIEMFCDRVAASMTYLGKNFTPSSPLEYFSAHSEKAEKFINPATFDFLRALLTKLAEINNIDLFIKWYKKNKKYLKIDYKNIV